MDRYILRTLAALAVASVSAVAVTADATSPPPLLSQTGTIPGFVDDAFIGTVDVPLNFVLFARATHWLGLSGADWEMLPEAPIEGTPFVTLTPPPEAGDTIALPAPSGYTGALRVVDYVDTTPPEPPVVASATSHSVEVRIREPGCGRGSYGNPETVLELEAGSDDFSPAERITYAIYVGDHADEVSARTSTYSYRLADIVEEGTALRLYAGAGDYVAIEAVDQAGNRSERSEPIRVAAASDGCTTAPAPIGTLAPLALVLVTLSARRASRRSRASRS